MVPLTISEVARQAGLRASAIRYYEQAGVLPPARRIAGQRRYDAAVLQRLAVVRRAQEAGFTLDEIRALFRQHSPASVRWKTMAQKKIAELDARMEQIRAMRDLLERLRSNCACETLEECGARIISASRPGGRSPRRDWPARG